MTPKLEVCVDSIDSALEAIKGGAQRLELCYALSEGGLTPSPGFLHYIKKCVPNICVFCMLRPRQGNDFQYSNHEMESILYDLDILKSLGSDGFVFGALDNFGNINVDQCQQIITACGNLPVTFHRAFDTTDPDKMIENCNLIKDLGFKRILTSGFKQTAELGVSNIKKLIDNCEDREFCIMPGSGITTQNVKSILKESNCREFHASARTEFLLSKQCAISMSNCSHPEKLYFTNSDIVREIVAIANMI